MTRARNSANLASHGNLFVDITNDRTGIGSVVPGQSLHVAGTAGFHGDATFTGDLYNTTWDRSDNSLKFADNAKAKFGTGGDLEIFHDGNHSRINDAGTGALIVSASKFQINNAAGNEVQAFFLQNGTSALYFDNSKKFETTAYGTNTTGTAVNDGLVVAGVATVTTMNVTGVLTYDDVTSIDSIGIITARSNIDCNGDLDVDGHTNLDNVSIAGFTTMSSNLRVVGDFTLEDNYPSIFLKDTDSDSDFMIQNQNGTFTIYDSTNNADRFEITSTGTVRSPHYTLQSQSPSLTFNDTNHDSDYMWQNANGLFKIYDNTNLADRFAVNSSGSVFVYGNELYIGDSIIHNGDANTKIRFPANDTVTVETVGSERLRIRADGTIRIGGDLYTSTSIMMTLKGSGTASQMQFHGTGTGDNSSDGLRVGYNGEGGQMWLFENEYLRFATNNGERVRITNDGKVGIGVEQPTTKLHVESTTGTATYVTVSQQKTYGVGTGTAERSGLNLAIREASQTAGNRIFGRIEVGTNSETSSTNGFMSFFTRESGGITEKLRIASDGKVGIGSVIPNAKLDVFATGGTIAQFGDPRSASFECIRIKNNVAAYPAISQDSTHDTLDLRSMGSVQATIDSNNNDTGNYFRVMANGEGDAGTEIFRAQEDGDVSIGGVTPARGPLHVHENSSSDCQIHLTNNDTGSSSGDGLTIYTDTDTSGIWSRENVDFQIATSNVERVRIYADGRMNIGGTNEVQLTASNQAVLYLHGAIVGADIDTATAIRTVMDDDNTGTTTGDRERGSAYFQFNGNASGGDTSNEARAWNIWSDLNLTTDYDNAYGIYADVRTTHTSGTMSTMRGCYGIVQSANSGTISEMVGVYGIAQPTTGSSGTIGDVVGVKARANMAAGTSSAKATDLFGCWAQIDNDNNVSQAASGTRTALFYGSYDKTTGLTNPQGIRIDTDVPNYFRGGIAIDGGTSFTPTGGHSIHIKNSNNATGIFLEQTGDQYNVIKGEANRSGADNAILDIQGWWGDTQVGRIRFDTGADTTNDDDGRLQFFTASAGTLTERMRIQENGEIAMRSSGTPSDALANLHVQNDTFRVSNDSDGANTTYIALTAHTAATDGDRNIYKHVKNGVIKSQITNNGHVFSHSSFYAGRTRTDANSPANVYQNGSNAFIAYSGRTDNTANYRGSISLRAWDGGDTGDRNIIYYTDSGSDTVTNDYDQHQYFGVKANGMVQTGSHVFVGRIESDEGSPNSVYRGTTGTAVIVYPDSSAQSTRIDARTTDNTDLVYRADTGGGVVIKFESQGNGRFDGGADVGAASDYAEYFEWTDGNTSSADRRGMTVILDGEKIRPATDSDDTSKIIGVVSANPAVVGDSAWSEWQLAHQKDVYGSWVTKDEEYLVWNKFGTFTDTDGVKKPNPQPDINDPNMSSECQILVSDIEKEKAAGNCPQAAIDQNLRVTKPSRIYNPDYDKTRTYVPRSERKEWDAIGLMGKLVVRRGQPIGANWILMKSNVGVDPNDNSIILDKYLVR